MLKQSCKEVFAIRHLPSGLYLPDKRNRFSEDCKYVEFSEARLTASSVVAIRRLASWLRGPISTSLEFEPDDLGNGFYYRTEPQDEGKPRDKAEFALVAFAVSETVEI